MTGRFSQSKGKRGEREIVNLLQPIVDTVYAEFPVFAEVPRLQRNTLQSDGGGYDLLGLEWLAIEVKFQEQLSVNSWWAQTEEQASAGQVPVLFYRKSRMQWRVMIPMSAPIGCGYRYTCPAEIPVDDFLAYFEHRLRSSLEEKAEVFESLPNSATVG